MNKIVEQKYIILGTGLSIIFLYLAFEKVDLKNLWFRLKKADLTYIFVAWLPLYASYITRTFLWQKIILPFKNVDFSNTFSALMIGFLGNNVLPVRAGEFMRAYILGNKENIGKTIILGTIVIERLFDIFTLLLFLVFSASVFPMPQWTKHIALTTFVILIVTLVIAYLVLLTQKSLLEVLGNKLFFLSNPKKQFVIKRLDSFRSGLGILRKPKRILMILIFSMATWLLASVSIFLTFKSIDINIPIYASLFVSSIINLGLIIPSSPGYIGTYQFLCVIALSAFWVNKETALTFSIIYHALWCLPLTFLGLVFLWRENLTLSKLRNIK